jgi:hypothetical protein
MRRIAGALREWLQLRARLHEERRFHLENAAADFRALGMSPRSAMRKARSRFGGRRHLRTGFRELGGDFAGLASLLRAHRVAASAWLQPALLVAAIVLMLFISPAPRLLVEGVIGTHLSSKDDQVVILAAQGWTPAERAVAAADFEMIRTLSTLTEVERYRTSFVRARAVHRANLASIQAEVRAKTGNRRLWAGWHFSETRIETGPAQAIWILLWFYVVFSLGQSIPSRSTIRGKVNWLLYGFLLAFLHTLASLMTWALTVQIWKWAPSSGVAASAIFSLVFLAYLLISAMQCRWWRSDLTQRCPVCLDRLMLPLTEGAPDRVLLESAITESICVHGHGVLVESRWSRRFRPEESPLRGLGVC